MIALILLMHPHVYICGHMYACMYACMYVLQYTRPQALKLTSLDLPPPPPPQYWKTSSVFVPLKYKFHKSILYPFNYLVNIPISLKTLQGLHLFPTTCRFLSLYLDR